MENTNTTTNTLDFSWAQNGKVNEVLFMQEFLKAYPMQAFEGRFYDTNGYVPSEKVKGRIFSMLKLAVTADLAKKTHQLFQALLFEADTDEMPEDMFTIRVKNGSLSVKDGFREENEVCRVRLPVPFEQDATEPARWYAFLNELLEPEDIVTLQEYLGYCLIPCTMGQIMLFLIGDGGEGKSRITQVCRAIFGEYMNVSSFHKLETNQFARADLEGKLLMIDDDMKLSALPSTNYIKSIVTQEGKIDTERKGMQSEQRHMNCRLLCLGNGSPNALYDHSNGFYRRQIILSTKPKDTSRRDDPYLTEKLQKELNGIFLWCFEGLKRLMENDFHFTISERAKKSLEELRESGNNVISFMKSECYFTLGEGLHATTADLYHSYQLWCRENAEICVALRSFSGYLKDHAAQYRLTASNNIPNREGRKVRGFYGIKVNVISDFVPYEGETPFD